jgi:hypothetical protein
LKRLEFFLLGEITLAVAVFQLLSPGFRWPLLIAVTLASEVIDAVPSLVACRAA